MKNLLYPKLSFRDALFILKIMILGCLAAGLFGIIHDQITYTISHEYFTRFKFNQFAQAKPNFGGNRVFVSVIGFLATWWVGAISAWILARLSILIKQQTRLPFRFIFKQFLLMLGITSMIGFCGYLYGILICDTTNSFWQAFVHHYKIEDIQSFAIVGCIHNSAYLGGAVGLVTAIINVVRYRRVFAVS